MDDVMAPRQQRKFWMSIGWNLTNSRYQAELALLLGRTRLERRIAAITSLHSAPSHFTCNRRSGPIVASRSAPRNGTLYEVRIRLALAGEGEGHTRFPHVRHESRDAGLGGEARDRNALEKLNAE